jgi:hypothetical protein
MVDAPDEPIPDPYTTEGTIARLGAFATGVNRAHGWRRAGGKAIIAVVLLPAACFYGYLGMNLLWEALRNVFGG